MTSGEMVNEESRRPPAPGVDDPVGGWAMVADMIRTGGFTVTSVVEMGGDQRPAAVTTVQLDGDVVTTVDERFLQDHQALASHHERVRAQFARLRRFAASMRTGPAVVAVGGFVAALLAVAPDLSLEAPWRSSGHLAMAVATPAGAWLGVRAGLAAVLRLLTPRFGEPSTEA